MTTARSIITRALRLDRIIAANESGDSADLDAGLTALNGMLGSWSLERNAVLATVKETFSATGATSYTIGTGGNFNTIAPISIPIIEYSLNGVDYELVEWTEQQYASIGIKNQAGTPQGYFYSRGAVLGTIYIADVAASGSFKLHSVKAITEFSGLDVAYDLAPGYLNALAYNLAVDLAPEFEAEAPKTVLVKAMNYKRTLKRSNAEIPVMDLGEVARKTFYGYDQL